MPVCSSKGLLEGLVGNVCVFEEFSFSTCSVLPVASLCFGNMGGPVECFNCGGDHFARDCPEGGKGKGKGKKGGKDSGCWNCGGDHIARDCPTGGKIGGKGGGKNVDCFNCGGPHFARDCPEGGKKGGKGKGKGGGKGICYDFRDNGSCKFGDECRFSHEA
ncbi:unnamed protein product [Effrenium voratum]|nr:unnamed protein product [Effrenium voratum]